MKTEIHAEFLGFRGKNEGRIDVHTDNHRSMGYRNHNLGDTRNFLMKIILSAPARRIYEALLSHAEGGAIIFPGGKTWRTIYVPNVTKGLPELEGRQISAYFGELGRKGLYAAAEGGGAKWWGRVLVKPQPEIEVDA
jgi:hypothetical protein